MVRIEKLTSPKWRLPKRAVRFWCILDLPGHHQGRRNSRSHWRKALGLAAFDFFEDIRKKAGQARDQVRWPDRFEGMIASGLKTAPPQVYPEVVSATNSACHLSPEAPLVSPIISFINQIAFLIDALRTQSALSFPLLTAPVGLHTASRSRTLSAPSVSGA